MAGGEARLWYTPLPKKPQTPVCDTHPCRKNVTYSKFSKTLAPPLSKFLRTPLNTVDDPHILPCWGGSLWFLKMRSTKVPCVYYKLYAFLLSETQLDRFTICSPHSAIKEIVVDYSNIGVDFDFFLLNSDIQDLCDNLLLKCQWHYFYMFIMTIEYAKRVSIFTQIKKNAQWLL